MSGFARKVGEIWESNRLFTVLLELTYRCNLDCFFCYNDVSLAGRALSRAQYDELLADLATLGTLQLSLTGGEPLAHPDFFHVGARARELGFVVRVKSNGHALRGALARRLVEEVDPFGVEISLHGARAETHDRQTRVAGSFDRLLSNLEELVGLGLRVKLNSTLTSWNENEVEGMFAIADRLGVRLQFDPDVTPRDDGDTSPLAVRASREGIARLFEIETERGRARAAAEGDGAANATATASTPDTPPEVLRQGDADVAPPSPGKYCGAGSSNLAIDPFGNVYPCVQWRRPIGNLHERPIRELWAGREVEGIRRITSDLPDRLRATGPDARFLNFCPGAAEQATGRPDEVYPAAAERRELLRDLSDREARRSRLPVLR